MAELHLSKYLLVFSNLFNLSMKSGPSLLIDLVFYDSAILVTTLPLPELVRGAEEGRSHINYPRSMNT